MDWGQESIEDRTELDRVRIQARRVHLQSIGLALALTLFLLLLPM